MRTLSCIHTENEVLLLSKEKQLKNRQLFWHEYCSIVPVSILEKDRIKHQQCAETAAMSSCHSFTDITSHSLNPDSLHSTHWWGLGWDPSARAHSLKQAPTECFSSINSRTFLFLILIISATSCSVSLLYLMSPTVTLSSRPWHAYVCRKEEGEQLTELHVFLPRPPPLTTVPGQWVGKSTLNVYKYFIANSIFKPVDGGRKSKADVSSFSMPSALLFVSYLFVSFPIPALHSVCLPLLSLPSASLFILPPFMCLIRGVAVSSFYLFTFWILMVKPKMEVEEEAEKGCCWLYCGRWRKESRL